MSSARVLYICRQIWIHIARAAQWRFNRVCFVAAVSPRTSELTSELGGKLVDRLIFFPSLRSGAPAIPTGDTKKVDRRQRQSQSIDIKGITETSLMWFPSVAIQLPRYARYLQFGRMSMAGLRQREGGESIRRSPLSTAILFIVHKDSFIWFYRRISKAREIELPIAPIAANWTIAIIKRIAIYFNDFPVYFFSSMYTLYRLSLLFFTWRATNFVR